MYSCLNYLRRWCHYDVPSRSFLKVLLISVQSLESIFMTRISVMMLMRSPPRLYAAHIKYEYDPKKNKNNNNY